MELVEKNKHNIDYKDEYIKMIIEDSLGRFLNSRKINNAFNDFINTKDTTRLDFIFNEFIRENLLEIDDRTFFNDFFRNNYIPKKQGKNEVVEASENEIDMIANWT